MSPPTVLRELVLASGSPRRSELLLREGYAFTVDVPRTEEPLLGHFTPRELVLRHARQKAAAVAPRHRDAVVLAADTLVVLAGQILGKPANLREAASMLQSLSGREHVVCTGVWICCRALHVSRGFVARTFVRFKTLSAADIRAYLRDVHTLDKAGAYAAQEEGTRIIKEVRGDFDNVVGLPVGEVRKYLDPLLCAQ